MMSHAAQIQALLARERTDAARWAQLGRPASDTDVHRAAGRQAPGAAAHPAAQARAVRRASDGPSATA